MPIALDAAEQLLKFVGFHWLKKESTSDVPKQMFLVASIADGQDDDSIRGAAAANDARNSVGRQKRDFACVCEIEGNIFRAERLSDHSEVPATNRRSTLCTIVRVAVEPSRNGRQMARWIWRLESE